MKPCKCGCGKEVPDNKEFVNGGHAAKWRKSQKELQSSSVDVSDLAKSRTSAQPSSVSEMIINTPDNPQQEKKSWYNRIFSKKPKENKYPSKLLTTKEIREIRQTEEKLTDEQKFLKFFGNLPKWTTKKPGFFTKWKLGKEFRHVVLVTDELDKQDTEAFIPYNKDLGVLQTDVSVYDMPVKEKGTIYLHARKFRPVVNGDDYAKEFDIPEDFATSLTNRGIKFGQLAHFDKVIKKIDMIMMCIWGLAIAVVLLGVFTLLTVYSDNKAIHDMAGQIGNMTQQLKVMNP